MADKIILVDTSILINYYRKTDKANSVWVKLIDQKYSFIISVITKYEIYSGATQSQFDFWNRIIATIKVYDLSEAAIDKAVQINNILKQQRNQLDTADLFIAATAVTSNLPFSNIQPQAF